MTTQPYRSELRTAFHRDVDRLEQDLQAMDDLARRALERATRALATDDQTLCQAVVDADDEIDRRYLDIERRVIGQLARQAPAAAEPRLLTAVLASVEPFEHLEWGVHMYEATRQLERAADHAVDIAEQVWFLVTGELQEFGDARAPAP